MDIKDEVKKSFLPAHCLYRYHANRVKESNKSGGSGDTPSSENPDSALDFFKKEATSDPNFSLSVVTTSLQPEHEAELRNFVSRRLLRGTLNSETGHISSLDFYISENEKQSAMCYYGLVRQDTGPNVSGAETQDKYTSNEFIVCFVTSSDIILDLFKMELDRYTAKLNTLLEVDPAELELRVRPYLEGWSKDVMEYVCRCVDIMGQDLQYLIFAALVDAKIVINCDDNDIYDNHIKTDLQRFMDCCSLSDFLASMKSDSPEACTPMSDNGYSANSTVQSSPSIALGITIDDEKTFTMTLKSDGTYNLSPEECTVFCEDWARALVKGEKDNPMFLRQVVENYKLKAIQDMNSLKRLIRLAETDHYSLFRSYQFLKNSNNSSVLLQHAKSEQHTLSSVAAAQVVQTLDQHMRPVHPSRLVHSSS